MGWIVYAAALPALSAMARLKMFFFLGPRLQMWAPMPASRKRADCFRVAQHSHSLMILWCRTFL